MEEMPEEIVVPDERLGITCLAHILKKDEAETQKYFNCLQLEQKANHPFRHIRTCT